MVNLRWRTFLRKKINQQVQIRLRGIFWFLWEIASNNPKLLHGIRKPYHYKDQKQFKNCIYRKLPTVLELTCSCCLKAFKEKSNLTYFSGYKWTTRQPKTQFGTIMANITSLILLNASIIKPSGYCENLQPFLDMDIRKKLPQYYVVASLTASFFMFMLCFFALFLNAVVVFVTWRTPALHSPRNILLCSLAATDFFVGFTSQPFFVVAELFLLFGQLERYCLTVFMLFYSSWLFNGISFLTLTAISFERYLALRFHLRYPELITASRVVITVVIYWLIWATLVTVLWFWATSKLLAYALTAVCFVLGVSALRCLSLIHKTMKRHNKHVRDTNQKTFQSMIRYRRSTNTMIILVAAFALSYIPFVITTAVSASQEQEDLRTSVAHCLAVAVMFANSSVNPVIYFWRVTELREAAERTLRRFHPLKTKRSDTEFDTR